MKVITANPKREIQFDADGYEVTRAGALILYKYQKTPEVDAPKSSWLDIFATPLPPVLPPPPKTVRVFAPGQWTGVDLSG